MSDDNRQEERGSSILLEREDEGEQQQAADDDEEEQTVVGASHSSVVAPQAARDHTYLPGTSHPLMSESMLLLSARAKRRRSSVHQTNDDNDDDGLVQIPLLLLPGVVIFPGTTLPIRLLHASWIDYLGQKIDASRRQLLGSADEEITIGVLTHIEPETRRASRQRSSWMRTGIDRRRSTDVMANILQHFDMDQLMEENEEEESEEEEEEPTIAPQDPLIGRIGTMVTITNTHETTDTDNSSSGVIWRQVSETGQLAVTALGTGRFRVIHAVDEGRRRPHNSSGYHQHDMSDVRFYRVQELFDEELPLPPIKLQGTSADRHDRIIDHIASVSPIPKFILQRMWPWKLVSEIQASIDRVQSLKGLNRPGRKEPISFSFWIASNLPLKESEKLDLLKMESTVERLKYLQVKVLALEKEQTFVCCKLCKTKLSATANMFTVGGAEGTTGAYVNEYGVIHQTVTLREVQEDDLLYTGEPETRDSWFPGYSWTIAYCRYCHSHLGWKFLCAERLDNTQVSDDRPERFWGLSGGSVTTIAPLTT